MTTGIYQWHKIAESAAELSFSGGGIAVAYAGEKRICVAHYKERLFAFAYTCPHASGVMADGFIDALGNVVCPTHRYTFNVQNGRNTSGEGFYLRHWPVEQREDGIWVGL